MLVNIFNEFESISNTENEYSKPDCFVPKLLTKIRFDTRITPNLNMCTDQDISRPSNRSTIQEISRFQIR